MIAASIIGQQAGGFVLRHWRWFAIGAMVLAAIIGFQIYKDQRNEARRAEAVAEAQRDRIQAQLAVSNASVAALQGKVQEQNAAIEQLDADGQKRLEEGRALILAEVRRGTASSEAARKLLANPKNSGDMSRTSDAVLAMRGEL